ncbi:hypothetical protein IP91_02593 [Pseudoduganella lurida]|uniref:Uncharacterized protein n=2 Tax=Pseudoduganella lurida TaxID=1036180 RepID=A0A562R9X7_9BURK|nr:hypothetical protein IP91_02593 [Pseudoduganella lurida]
MTKNVPTKNHVSASGADATGNAVRAHKRGAIVVLREGALDYRNYPSLAGGQRLPYKSGTHLGEK